MYGNDFINLYLIIKNAQKATPFNKDNIRIFREIGIFSIVIPIIGLIMSTICRLILGHDNVEISVNLYAVVMGILIIGLIQFFIYGAKLEKDVDLLV